MTSGDYLEALRLRAEAQQALLPRITSDVVGLSNAALIHRLQVHKIELEMQNDELRRSHAELEAVQLRYFDLYDLAPVGYCTLDPDGLILQCNLIFASLLGLARSKLIKRPLSVFICQEHVDRYQLLRQHVSKSATTSSGEFRMLNGSTKEYWVLLALSAEKGQSGGTDLRIVVTNISEFKWAALALQNSEANFRALFEQVAVGVCLVDAKTGRYVRVNKYFCDLLGYEPSELLLLDTHKLTYPDDRAAVEILWYRISTGANRECSNEQRFLHKNGQLIWVQQQISSMIEEGVQTSFSIVVVTDLTERKQREAAKQILESQRLESIGVLAGGIAHDFNNILAGILGNANLGKMNLPVEAPAQKYLKTIEEGATRGAELCRQILNYAGKGTFERKTFCLNQLIEQTARLLELSIGKKIVIHYNLHPDLPGIEGDASQIRQVIMNLVLNASDAIGEGAGVISLSTGLDAAPRSAAGSLNFMPKLTEGACIYLEVADSGCGMSAATLSKIYEPFFTTKFAGRGLGLPAVHGIMRRHNGAISVQSVLGQGTTFRLLFQPAKNGGDTIEVVSEVDVTWRGEGCILLIEDDEVVRLTIVDMLEIMGFTTVMATDGREGVDIFQSDPSRFALVMTDLTMPRLDGGEVCLEVHRIKPGMPVVMISGYNEADLGARFSEAGLAGFLQKPFNFESLGVVLKKALQRGPADTHRAPDKK
jgi:two-component system cell cycle sensor histidine kinase/response regulator CckA